MDKLKTVFVTGGAGYVGSALIPTLLDNDYEVRVLDLCIYGENVFGEHQNHPNLTLIKGDIRDQELLKSSIEGADAVIHLACISNDPSFELNPELGKTINYDAFIPLVEISKSLGVKRFIYASSSSVYGIKEVENVTEDLPLEPLTDYSRFKADCEEELLKRAEEGFTTLIVRPATVCGYAPRQRLDVIVNILSNHAFHNRKIKVFGGEQKRPNIHIKDMVRFYLNSLEWESEKIDRKIYNAGYHNHTVNQIAKIVRHNIGEDVVLEKTPTDDNRSYHISSQKIKDELGFEAKHSIEEAVVGLCQAFESGNLPDSMNDSKYFNIKRMQEIDLV
ncbi:MAG: NAD-dependent epimerase/dehydratase family protein [Opitutales bacterium]|nr:NAD-dependent epimerase/dehydratase family protein [Opitutales bacterium]